VKYGREALQWNKYFHLFVWVFAVPSIFPIALGIYSNVDFPMFVPSLDLQTVIIQTAQLTAVMPSIPTAKKSYIK